MNNKIEKSFSLFKKDTYINIILALIPFIILLVLVIWAFLLTINDTSGTNPAPWIIIILGPFLIITGIDLIYFTIRALVFKNFYNQLLLDNYNNELLKKGIRLSKTFQILDIISIVGICTIVPPIIIFRIFKLIGIYQCKNLKEGCIENLNNYQNQYNY